MNKSGTLQAIKCPVLALLVGFEWWLDPVNISAAMMYQRADRMRVLAVLAALLTVACVVWACGGAIRRVRAWRRRESVNPVQG